MWVVGSHVGGGEAVFYVSPDFAMWVEGSCVGGEKSCGQWASCVLCFP